MVVIGAVGIGAFIVGVRQALPPKNCGVFLPLMAAHVAWAVSVGIIRTESAAVAFGLSASSASAYAIGRLPRLRGMAGRLAVQLGV